MIEVLFCTNVSVICCWSFKTCMRAFILTFHLCSFFVFSFSIRIWICISGAYLYFVWEIFFRARHANTSSFRITKIFQPNFDANVHSMFLSALRRNGAPACAMRISSMHFLLFVRYFNSLVWPNVIDAIHCSNNNCILPLK